MRAALTALACVVLALPLSAQGPSRLGLTAPTARATTSSSPFAPRDVAPNEWQKGMVIGGVVGLGFGLLLVAASQSLCDQDCTGSRIPLVLGPTAVFALLGGMIGTAFHKKE